MCWALTDLRRDGRKTRKPRWTPLLPHLAVDLREWSLASGRSGPDAPVFPAHDGDHWDDDDWRNWRRRSWQRVAPAGTRPRVGVIANFDGRRVPSDEQIGAARSELAASVLGS